MNLDKLFSHQNLINSKISVDKNLSEYKITARKQLTLQVRLSDLANETKCFNYSTEKETKISKQLVLEKYVDCLGHILTLGIDKNYVTLNSITIKPNDYCLSDQFLNLFIDLNDLIISPSIDHYETLLEDFMSLGVSLGFSSDQIEERFFNINYCKIAL
ncbi:Dimeric dUTPase, all-alpha-NTP-PPase (MazG) superfamily [Clostridium cavendishii DSM 21758]|uniref:Dimeric dUTPase, all-alpha-NTP-PPase (MazG) superfamily n=1 Tax=Clostridium cavendishii DSM 21758 TaxID=1121302 RepID=A0A1M6PSY7_9CLOT|nr:dUTP diphosphatase [Clostridium cavendishii]SHK11020.1 Dimeric dUTPase, all-alpha-NTP-PPase (MazG) superfamily [Clostridium cavendishii DSM 21758]